MAKARLDRELLTKLAAKTGKAEKYVREQISKRASRMGISSEAAQILWAKEFGIGTASFHRGLAPHMQEEVRVATPFVALTQQGTITGARRTKKAGSVTKKFDEIRFAIEFLLEDGELKVRCSDLLRASGHYDRVFREATTVLDDRLKKLGGVTGKMNPVDLVGKVLNPDPAKAVLRVSNDADEQEGIFSICKGLMLAFRNPAHHRLSAAFSRREAFRFCAFVDILLGVLRDAKKATAAP